MTLSDVCNIPAVIWISNWKFFCVVVAALGQKSFRTSKQTNPLTRPSLFCPFSQQTTEQRCCGYHGEEAWKFWKSEKFLKNSKIFWRLTFNVNWWIKFAFWSSLYKFWSMHNFAHHQIRHFNSSTSGDQHSNRILKTIGYVRVPRTFSDHSCFYGTSNVRKPLYCNDSADVTFCHQYKWNSSPVF